MNLYHEGFSIFFILSAETQAQFTRKKMRLRDLRQQMNLLAA